MNKRQKKKWRKKERLRLEAYYKKIGVDKWASSIVTKNIAEQIMTGEVVDVGIRVKLPTPPKFFELEKK